MDLAGLVAIGAVAVAGIVIGVWRNRTDGQFRDETTPPTPSASPTPPTPPASLTAAAAGVPDAVAGPDDAAGSRPAVRLDPELLDELGVGSDPVTFLQFSSAFCAPCRAVRRVSAEVAAMLPGVRHVEVDAESHLSAVRTLGIWRTPTVLVLDGQGRIVKRATGVPTKPQLIAVAGELLG